MYNDMDPESQKYLNEVLKKDAAELSEADIRFLRARRDYLNDDELSRYESVLSGEVPQSSSTADMETPKLNRNELVKEAKALGIKVGRDMKAPQIKALIDNAKFEAEAEAERKEAEEAERKAKEEADAAAAAKEAEDAKSEKAHKGNFSEDSQAGAQAASEQ